MAENVIEKLTKDRERNTQNPLMLDQDDNYFGKRKSGGFVKEVLYDHHQSIHYIFDDGNNYIFDIEDRILYPMGRLDVSRLLHKYIEKLISDFSKEHGLNVSIRQCDVTEINAMPFVKLLPEHDEKIVYLPNILVPPEKAHTNLGKSFISRLFNLCQKYGYRLILLDVLDRFRESLEKRGAIVFNYDSVEITNNTDLTFKY